MSIALSGPCQRVLSLGPFCYLCRRGEGIHFHVSCPPPPTPSRDWWARYLPEEGRWRERRRLHIDGTVRTGTSVRRSGSCTWQCWKIAREGNCSPWALFYAFCILHIYHLQLIHFAILYRFYAILIFTIICIYLIAKLTHCTFCVKNE